MHALEGSPVPTPDDASPRRWSLRNDRPTVPQPSHRSRKAMISARPAAVSKWPVA